MLQPVLQAFGTRLPALSAAEAACCRGLFDRRLELQLAQVLPGLRVRRLDPAHAVWPEGVDLVLSAPGVQLVLGLPVQSDGMVGTVMNAPGWSLADRMMCLLSLVRDSLTPLHDWVQSLGLRLVDVRRRSPADAPPPRIGAGLALEFQRASLAVPMVLQVTGPGLPTAWLTRLAEQLSAHEEAAVSTLSRLELPLSFSFGHRRMAQKSVAQLEPGDVLLLPMLPELPGQVGSVPGHLAAGPGGQAPSVRHARLGRRHLTVTGESWMIETPLADIPSAVNESLAGNAIAGIEVELHLELASIRLSIGALAAMRPGFVLELPMAPEDTPISLMVGGQLFGRAQLVCIGDRMGAQILELNHDTQRPDSL